MKLKDYLRKYKITVREFADRVDVGSSTIASYLGGWRQPSSRRAKRIEKESDGVVKVADVRRETGIKKGPRPSHDGNSI